MENNKLSILKICRNAIFNKTGNWQMAAHMKDEDVIEWMNENYPEFLKNSTWED